MDTVAIILTAIALVALGLNITLVVYIANNADSRKALIELLENQSNNWFEYSQNQREDLLEIVCELLPEEKDVHVE